MSSPTQDRDRLTSVTADPTRVGELMKKPIHCQHHSNVTAGRIQVIIVAMALLGKGHQLALFACMDELREPIVFVCAIRTVRVHIDPCIDVNSIALSHVDTDINPIGCLDCARLCF